MDELNVRARSARLAALAQADPQWRPGRETVLSDHLAASAGDIIRTRDNARWLRLSATDYVRNGYTFEVLDVGADGSLRVRHIGTDREITLPADYVTSDVTLGYATTIDGAQGLTAGYSCHVVAAEHITRQLLYVALTRGRVENHVYLSTAEDDPHRILAPKATHPDTAVDVLAKILARDGAQVSATTAQREAANPLLRIAAAADMYHDALGTAAENHLGATRLDKIATLADTLYAPHPRARLARAAQPPGPAGLRRTQPRRGPIGGRSLRWARRRRRPGRCSGLAHRPHRRPFGRRRPVALAARATGPTRPESAMGSIPASSRRSRHRTGRPHPSRRTRLDTGHRTRMGQTAGRNRPRSWPPKSPCSVRRTG